MKTTKERLSAAREEIFKIQYYREYPMTEKDLCFIQQSVFKSAGIFPAILPNTRFELRDYNITAEYPQQTTTNFTS